jgi:UDP-N-acetylglucosamine acyltransferase
MTTLIHPTAVIHPNANLHPTVQVGPYAVIGPEVTIGAGTTIGAHVVLDGWTEIGARNQIFPGAAIGLEPQDLKYQGARTLVKIGDDNIIREYVTIHRATFPGEETRLGNSNLLMVYSHMGHNCIIEDEVIVANSVALGGHVYIESRARISGVQGVHQFVHIGRHAMVAGSRLIRDVPPYMLVEGSPMRVRTLNRVGLQRAGVDTSGLRQAFRVLYRSGLTLTEALDKLEATASDEHVQHLCRFLRESQQPGRRGPVTGKRLGDTSDDE